MSVFLLNQEVLFAVLQALVGAPEWSIMLEKNIVYAILHVYSNHEIKMYPDCFQKCTFLDLSRRLAYVIKSINTISTVKLQKLNGLQIAIHIYR